MDSPTATDIRDWAPPLFAWDSYGFPAPADGSPTDPLDIRVVWSISSLYSVTGRTLTSILAEEVGTVQKVLVALTMHEAVGGGEGALSVLEQPWLKSFTAGSYSETRFSPQELGTTKSPPFPPLLWALLWSLMTDEKRDEWTETLGGRRRPEAGFTQMGGFGSPMGPSWTDDPFISEDYWS